MSNNSDLSHIEAIITDIDGVLTDGTYYYDGEKLGRNRAFNVKDLYAFKLCKKFNIRTGIITAGDSISVRKFTETIPVNVVKFGIKNKLNELKRFATDLELNLDKVAYLGDDYPDFQCLNEVGYSFCPSDAIENLKISCSKVLKSRAGRGCFREVVEGILDARAIPVVDRLL